MNRNIEIILIAVAFAALGARIYQKYVKRKSAGSDIPRNKKNSSSFSDQHDDDYEPNSKK
jgi:hypothetical protein